MTFQKNDSLRTGKLPELALFESCQLWLESFKSQKTKKSYTMHLQMFCRFYQTTPDDLLLRTDSELETMLTRYIIHLKKVAVPTTQKPINGRISINTIGGYIYGVRKFLKFHKRHKSIDWEQLQDILPEKQRGTWRAYTREEIQTIMTVADMRQKAMILLMTSGGIRVGGLSNLRFRDIRPLPYGLATISIYADSAKHHYFTLLTAECMNTIETYKGWRMQQHERLNGDSFVLRDKFIPFSSKTNRPKQLQVESIMTEMRRLIKRALPSEVTDKVQTDHGFRKYFDTMCMNSDVNHSFKEMLMGHSIALDEVYYDEQNPHSRNKIMNEYLKAADALTINDEHRLQLKVNNLETEKEKLIKTLENRVTHLEESSVINTNKQVTALNDIGLSTDQIVKLLHIADVFKSIDRGNPEQTLDRIMKLCDRQAESEDSESST